MAAQDMRHYSKRRYLHARRTVAQTLGRFSNYRKQHPFTLGYGNRRAPFSLLEPLVESKPPALHGPSIAQDLFTDLTTVLCQALSNQHWDERLWQSFEDPPPKITHRGPMRGQRPPQPPHEKPYQKPRHMSNKFPEGKMDIKSNKKRRSSNDLDLASAVDQLKSLKNHPGNIAIGDRYTVDDLQLLYDKAIKFYNDVKGKDITCKAFYRDKSLEYYTDINENCSGVMNTYTKDLHGDPKSPINGRLKGLFFNIRAEQNGEIPLTSLFGEQRLIVPVKNLVDDDTNLYFTDFYCNTRQHYVTLILATEGSESDDFCQEHLLQIKIKDNPFFKVSKRENKMIILTQWNPIVEVLYTQHIDINAELKNGSLFTTTDMRFFRNELSLGIRKNKACKICNL